MIIDSYILFTDNHGKSSVLPKEVFLGKATQEEKDLLNIYLVDNILVDLKKIRINQIADLVPCGSDSLFEKAYKESRTFIRKNGIYTSIAKSKITQKCENLVSSFNVIIVNFHKLKNLYLYKNTSPIMASVDDDNIEEENDLENRKSTSVFERKLFMSSFVLTDIDLQLMKKFVKVEKTISLAMARKTLEECYYYVMAKFKNPFIMPSWRNPLDGDTFPKGVESSTLEQYGNRGAILLYLIKNFHLFSFGKDSLSFWDERSSFEDQLPKVLYNILGSVYYSECGKIIIKMLALDWEEYTTNLPRYLKIDEYRKNLDVYKFFLFQGSATYGTVKKLSHEIEGLFNKPFFLYLSNIYHEVGTESVDTQSKKEASQHGADHLALNGLVASKSYFQKFYYEVATNYDKILRTINDTLLPLSSIEHVASRLLDSNDSNINLFDDRSNPNKNMRKMFSRSLLDSVHPSEADLINFDKKKFLKLSNELTYYMMWLVYFGAGGPMRASEIAILKYGGKNKDIFIDPMFRRLEILSTYCKSGNNDVKVKVMDKCTSDYLFHYLFVIRPIQIYCMDGNFSNIDQNLLSDKTLSVKLKKLVKVKVRGPNNDDNSCGKLVMKSFIFIDVLSGCLIRTEHFRRGAARFPSSIPPTQRFNYSNMRQALIGLFRQFGPSKEKIDSIEYFAGHTSQTGYNNYNVNLSLSSSGSVSNKIKYETALRWVEWFELEKGYRKKIEDLAVVDMPQEHPYWAIPKSQLALYVAGYQFFGS